MAALLTPVGAVGAVNACSDGVHLCAFRRDDGDCFGNGHDKARDHDIQHDANDGTQPLSTRLIAIEMPSA